VLASFICALPGCDRPCLVDKRAGVVHDFCSREHELQQLTGAVHGHLSGGERRTASSVDVDIADDEDAQLALASFECQLPGCTRRAHVDYEGGLVHDYCSRDHAILDMRARDSGAHARGMDAHDHVGGGAFGFSGMFARLDMHTASGLGLGPPFGSSASGARGGGGGPHVPSTDEVDIDNMSRDDLLALSERIGSVKVGLTRRQVQSLPLHTYTGTHSGDQDSSDDEDGKAPSCVICVCELERGDEVRTLPCKHMFHRACIDKWLTSDAFGAKSCPVCMKEVKVRRGCKA